jgi:hypothetical protein
VCVTFSSHPVLEQQLVLATAPRSFFMVGYENAEVFSTELVNAFLKPVIGTAAAADRFQELNAGLGSVDLLAREPALRNLRVLTQIAWAPTTSSSTSNGSTGCAARFPPPTR